MKMKKTEGIRISGTDYVLAPHKTDEIALNISLREWENIKSRIEKIDSSSSKLSFASSFCWGFAGSSFLAIFSFIKPLQIILLVITISICICSIIVGIVLKIACKSEKHFQNETKKCVLEYMSDIQERFDIPNS